MKLTFCAGWWNPWCYKGFAYRKSTSVSYQNRRTDLVGVRWLEHPASCSQSKRATNCATPRNIQLKSQNNRFCVFRACFARPLAVPKIFYGLKRRKILTAAPMRPPFICHRQRSATLPKASAQGRATPRNKNEALACARMKQRQSRHEAQNGVLHEAFASQTLFWTTKLYLIFLPLSTAKYSDLLFSESLR